jgi:phospholipid transport system substrate-binding protein
MTERIYLISLLLLGTHCLIAPPMIRAGEPLDLMQSTIDRGLQLFKEPTLQSRDKEKERAARMREIANSIVDFEEMTKLAVGPQWTRMTPAQQEEILRLFRPLLEKIISDWNPEKMVLGRETIERDVAQVESSEVNSRGYQVPVVYKLRRVDGTWKIYDEVIGNVSVVNNFRVQFDRVTSKSSSFEELTKLLREKAENN